MLEGRIAFADELVQGSNHIEGEQEIPAISSYVERPLWTRPRQILPGYDRHTGTSWILGHWPISWLKHVNIFGLACIEDVLLNFLP